MRPTRTMIVVGATLLGLGGLAAVALATNGEPARPAAATAPADTSQGGSGTSEAVRDDEARGDDDRDEAERGDDDRDEAERGDDDRDEAEHGDDDHADDDHGDDHDGSGKGREDDD